MNNFEAGNELDDAQASAIRVVLEKLAPESPVTEPAPNAEMLALKKAKFNLLLKDLNID